MALWAIKTIHNRKNGTNQRTIVELLRNVNFFLCPLLYMYIILPIYHGIHGYTVSIQAYITALHSQCIVQSMVYVYYMNTLYPYKHIHCIRAIHSSDVQICYQRLRLLWYWLNPNHKRTLTYSWHLWDFDGKLGHYWPRKISLFLK